jgi:serine/threonine-protein kinase ULK4
MGFEIIEGLSYLHSNGVIYSDLKPQNILLNEYNILKLCDFGLSKKITDLTQTDSDPSKLKAGTPYYMAPELFSDNGIHTYFSDFWSLGCVLFELATGKPPFCTNSLKDLITMILEANHPKVEGFSDEFNDLLNKLLEKDPIKRINWEELKGH